MFYGKKIPCSNKTGLMQRSCAFELCAGVMRNTYAPRRVQELCAGSCAGLPHYAAAHAMSLGCMLVGQVVALTPGDPSHPELRGSSTLVLCEVCVPGCTVRSCREYVRFLLNRYVCVMRRSGCYALFAKIVMLGVVRVLCA